MLPFPPEMKQKLETFTKERGFTLHYFAGRSGREAAYFSPTQDDKTLAICYWPEYQQYFVEHHISFNALRREVEALLRLNPCPEHMGTEDGVVCISYDNPRDAAWARNDKRFQVITCSNARGEVGPVQVKPAHSNPDLLAANPGEMGAALFADYPGTVAMATSRSSASHSSSVSSSVPVFSGR